MKRLISISLFLLLSTISYAQHSNPLVGDWLGSLKIHGMSVDMVFHIMQYNSQLITTVYSPDKLSRYAADASFFDANTKSFEIALLEGKYVGKLENDSIVGTYSDGDYCVSLNIKRMNQNVQTQDGDKYSERVSFKNDEANISLMGTLVLPSQNGKYPIMVLVSEGISLGVREDNSHSQIFPAIAKNLALHGIGSLCIDNRGEGQSEGKMEYSNSADFATDVESAIKYLQTRKEVDATKIGLVGYNEGSIDVSMVASRSSNIKCLAMLAGIGLRGDKVLVKQQEDYLRIENAPDSIVQQFVSFLKDFTNIVVTSDSSQYDANLKSYFKSFEKRREAGYCKDLSPDAIRGIVLGLSMSCNFDFCKTDPAVYLQKVKCPVLAINGENDIVISPKENSEGIQKALSEGGNKDIEVKIFPNVNNSLQEGTTGTPADCFFSRDGELSAELLEYVTQWIIVHSK